MTELEIDVEGQKNWLPRDGTVHYYGPIVDRGEADRVFEALLGEVAWVHDQARMFGRTIVTKRKVAWYADSPMTYTYSKVTKTARPWIPILEEVKEKTEDILGASFNSCLLNLYHTGEEGMAWHSDGEKELVKHGVIASLSFGAKRRFALKHKETKDVVSLELENGSLLVMRDETQSHWLHRLPPTKKVKEARVNLTFRQMRSA